MQLQPAALRHRRQPFDPIDLQIGFAIARDLGEFQQVRTTRHGVALKEGLALDAVGRAHHGARPALDVADHPVADGFEIPGKIELGDGLAIAAIGPQRLVGFGDDDAHHLGGFVRR